MLVKRVPEGRILTACAISVLRDDIKYHIFMVSQRNSPRFGVCIITKIRAWPKAKPYRFIDMFLILLFQIGADGQSGLSRGVIRSELTSGPPLTSSSGKNEVFCGINIWENMKYGQGTKYKCHNPHVNLRLYTNLILHGLTYVWIKYKPLYKCNFQFTTHKNLFQIWLWHIYLSVSLTISQQWHSSRLSTNGATSHCVHQIHSYLNIAA